MTSAKIRLYSNYATVIATLRDPFEKQNPDQLQVVRVIFPTPWTSYRKLLGVLISSLRCLLLLWLTAVISLALIFRQPSKNGYKTTKNGLQWSILSRQLTVVYHKAFFFPEYSFFFICQLTSATAFPMLSTKPETTPDSLAASSNVWERSLTASFIPWAASEIAGSASTNWRKKERQQLLAVLVPSTPFWRIVPTETCCLKC